MKRMYNDFISANPNCSGLSSSKTAEAVFDFLSRDENIISMIESADAQQPALAGCVQELEAFYDGIQDKDMDLEDFNKQAVGRMIKTILEPFGYVPTGQKYLSKALNTKYFKSAKCYSLTNPASMKVIKKIVEV